MNRKIITTLVAVLVLSTLIGCGKKNDEIDLGDLPVEEDLITSSDGYIPSDVTFETYDPEKIYVPLTTLKEKLVDPAKDVISAIRNGDDEVDLSEYDLTSTDIKELWYVVCYSNPIGLLVGYDPDESSPSNLKLFYPNDKEAIMESIFAFEADMDAALTEIKNGYTMDSEISRECYNYVLNHFEYKDVFEKRAEDKELSSNMQQFFDEYNNGELSYVNATCLYSFMLNQFDIQSVGVLMIGTYVESETDQVLDEEYEGASQILNNAVAIDGTSYICDIAMDMVSKGGLDNSDYEPRFFGMGLETRTESYTVYGGQIITLLSPNYGLNSTNPSKEDMFNND